MERIIPKYVFDKNMDNFRSLLPADHIAVFFSDPPFRDVMQPAFEAYLDRNFYYLSGITATNLCLVFYPSHINPIIYSLNSEYITNDFEVRDGKSLLADLTNEMNSGSNKFSFFSYEKNLLNEENKIGLLVKKLQGLNSEVEINNCFEIIKKLRSKKHEEEIECIREACIQTGNALMKAATLITPGTYEYELRADYKYQLEKRGFSPSFMMFASGQNSLHLHYSGDRRAISSGDIVLFDGGSLYAYYTSDISRVFSSSCSFSKEQAYIYDLLLEAQQFAVSLLTPGNTLKENSSKVNKFIFNGLAKKGIIDEGDEVERYCLHGIGHPIGLYVHDPGNNDDFITENNVYALEPGVYLPKYGFGMRIEDCFFLGNTGVQCLSGDIPQKREILEKMTAKKWSGCSLKYS